MLLPLSFTMLDLAPKLEPPLTSVDWTSIQPLLDAKTSTEREAANKSPLPLLTESAQKDGRTKDVVSVPLNAHRDGKTEDTGAWNQKLRFFPSTLLRTTATRRKRNANRLETSLFLNAQRCTRESEETSVLQNAHSDGTTRDQDVRSHTISTLDIHSPGSMEKTKKLQAPHSCLTTNFKFYI